MLLQTFLFFIELTAHMNSKFAIIIDSNCFYLILISLDTFFVGIQLTFYLINYNLFTKSK